MKKVIVITGGIASGKSYIINILKDLGYPTMQSDNIANNIMQESWFLDKMKNILGREHLDIKQIIEDDSKVLDIIEGIIHPEIANFRQRFIDDAHSNNLLPIIEIPLFFERNISKTLLQYQLYTISTICGRKLQIKRAKGRHKSISDKMLDIIFARQIDDKKRLAMSDFIIYTSLDKSVVKKQLITIFNNI